MSISTAQLEWFFTRPYRVVARDRRELELMLWLIGLLLDRAGANGH